MVGAKTATYKFVEFSLSGHLAPSADGQSTVIAL